MKNKVKKEKTINCLKGRRLAKHLDAKMPWYLKREPDRKRNDNFCDSSVDYII